MFLSTGYGTHKIFKACERIKWSLFVLYGQPLWNSFKLPIPKVGSWGRRQFLSLDDRCNLTFQGGVGKCGQWSKSLAIKDFLHFVHPPLLRSLLNKDFMFHVTGPGSDDHGSFARPWEIRDSAGCVCREWTPITRPNGPVSFLETPQKTTFFFRSFRVWEEFSSRLWHSW